ncbi:uncharacterized protein LOC103170493 [Ornithorhynchus anatinus]|uniref:uncharacterized protein LOC103170493 n=1 Tax=Ornithorhynchus anatinus TaxID=9258 RepID=UPI0010A85636|nr:uncharacterized protein LOC103170493 [Ornithorhynchus anatinus]
MAYFPSRCRDCPESLRARPDRELIYPPRGGNLPPRTPSGPQRSPPVLPGLDREETSPASDPGPKRLRDTREVGGYQRGKDAPPQDQRLRDREAGQQSLQSRGRSGNMRVHPTRLLLFSNNNDSSSSNSGKKRTASTPGLRSLRLRQTRDGRRWMERRTAAPHPADSAAARAPRPSDRPLFGRTGAGKTLLRARTHFGVFPRRMTTPHSSLYADIYEIYAQCVPSSKETTKRPSLRAAGASLRGRPRAAGRRAQRSLGNNRLCKGSGGLRASASRPGMARNSKVRCVQEGVLGSVRVCLRVS